MRSPVLALLLLLGLPLAVSGCRSGAEEPHLVVRRGELATRLLLTGELEAASSVRFGVPRTPSWQVQVRWLAEDGAEVGAGERVAEFDSGDLARQRADAELALARAGEELVRKSAEAEQTGAERRFALEEARVRLTAAELDAAVPAELLAGRTHQERRLALERARANLEKAERALAAWQVEETSERALAKLELDRSARLLAAAEEAIGGLVARAPNAGIFVVARHPWEPRRLQVGDAVYPGHEIGSLPDLASLRVRAQLFDVDGERVTLATEGLCTVDAFPGEEVPCRVEEVSPVAREGERLSTRRVFTVRLSLARVDVERMRPGQSVKVALTTGRVPEALLAPRAGLDLAASPPRARLAHGELREIRLGPCGPHDCVVEAGLAEGDELAAGGPG
ncbi:MAG TPA: hypothetical protein VLA75_02345 [Thermoanaerobaculia bacterium]|nr:hypothetical protein [Thermoanaerobaculia bacterium]